MQHRAYIGRRLRHLGLGVVSVSLLATALLPTAAIAAPGEHDTFRVDETYTEDVCGLSDTATHLEIKGNVHFLSGGTIIDNTQLRVTWTNDDGDWVTATVEGTTKVSATDNGDGTLIEVSSSSGPLQWRSSEGMLYMDRGRIVSESVIDLGDPEDPDDDVFISSEVIFLAGPHPQYESDFTLFCPAVLSVLG
jgi:hypothetical protein